MSARLDEDTWAQQARAAATAAILEQALHRLATEAKTAARRAGTVTKRPKAIDLTALDTAHRAVGRASEDHYIALTDLATASGADL